MTTALAEPPRLRKFLPPRFGSKFKMSPTPRLLFQISVRAIVSRVFTLPCFGEAVCDFSHKGIGGSKIRSQTPSGFI
ncbi:hypothetical protein [Mesorhizobium sp. ZC-5]|uniref:hypothetical protein n=1 Tax=Mesorhizobium sp. ZC-5 TaxID=2986066 RepID=UPI0021E99DAA|nr:hypothetical protein [Mesorhizobium sp. ZC-5]MCV3243488.1 hypothetical protein [Mesorhizobium sp. ZC-5]